MADRTVSVRLQAEVGQYVSSMTKASAATKTVGDSADVAGKRTRSSFDLAGKGAFLLAGAGAAGVVALRGVITSASDLNETMNKSSVIFGDNAGQINKWASGAAKNLGLSKGAALEAAAGFGNMFTQLGFSGDAATDMSKQVVQLSADLGSFNNLPTAEVADMMSAAFRGEYDSLQRLIPNINAARVESEAMAMTGKENAKQLTAQEKAAAVLAIVNKDGAASAGDFAKTSDGLANSSKIAAAQFEDLQASIGQKFLPIATAAMGFVSDVAIPALDGVFGVVSGVAEAFGDLPGPVKLAVGALGGVALLKGPVSSAFEAFSLKAVNASGALTRAGGAMGALRKTGSGLVSMFGGPFGIATAGAAIGIGLITNAITKSNEQADQWVDALNKGGDAAVRARQQMTAAAGSTDDFEVIGRAIAEWAGLADSVEDVEAANRAYWRSLDPIQQAQAKVAEWTSTLSSRIETLGKNHEDTRIAQERLAYWTALLEGRQTNLAAATGEVAGAAGTAAKEVRALKDRLDDLTGETVTAMEAEANFQGAILNAKDATEGMSGAVTRANGKLDLHTEAGQAAFDALVNLRDSSNDVIDSMRVQGASAEQMAKKDQALRVSFIQTAKQMGFSQKEAQRLADDILGIPAKRNTEITAPTKGARLQVRSLQDAINLLKGRTINITASVSASLNSILGGFGLDWLGRGHAEGGYTGDGGKYQPMGIVHGGEWVTTKERTAKYRPLLEAIHHDRVPGYANGGPVGVVANFDDRQAAVDIRSFNERLRKLLEPGTGLVAALNWARTQVGKPYIWGGVGPTGYDCSGFMSAVTNVARGRNPYSRVGATSTFPWSGFLPGYGQFTIGSTKNAGGGIGHMAGTIMGVNVESAGGVGVRTGSSARGASDGLFGTRAHLAMYGGGIIGEPVVGIGARSGNTYSFGERGPETVTPGIRSREFGGVSAGGGGIDYELLAAAVGARSTNVNVTAPPDLAAIARAVAFELQKMEFLRG